MRYAKARSVCPLALVAFLVNLFIAPVGASAGLSVSFMTPREGEVCSDGSLRADAVITGRTSGVAVGLLVDGTLAQTKSVSPLAGRALVSFVLKAGAVPPGTRVLTLVAKSSTGVQAVARVRVHVNASSTPSLDAPVLEGPTDGATVSGKVAVRVRPKTPGPHAVALIEDGRLRSLTNIEPFSFDWDTSRLAAGTHMLQAEVRDSEGNVLVSRAITVTVENAESLIAATSQSAAASRPAASQSATAACGSVRDFSAMPSAPQLRQDVIALSETPEVHVPTTGAAKTPAWQMELTAAPGQASAVSQSLQGPTTGIASPAAPQTDVASFPRPLLREPEGAAMSLPPAVPLAAAKPPSTPAVARAAQSQDRVLWHMVAKRDSLWTISRRYHCSVDQLMRANGLVSDRLQIGQRLRVPVRPVLLVDGKTLRVRPEPFFRNGRLMVPLRALVEACGGQVQWRAADRTITLSVESVRATLRPGDARVMVNGRPITMDAKTLLVDGRAYVPLESAAQVAMLPVRSQMEESAIETAAVPAL